MATDTIFHPNGSPGETMPISVVCSSCGHRLIAPDKLAGRKGKCPECHALITVPSVPDAPGGPSLPEARWDTNAPPVRQPKAADTPPSALVPIGECPSCDTAVSVPEELVGHWIECPACGTGFAAIIGDLLPPSEDESLGRRPSRREGKMSRSPEIIVGKSGLFGKISDKHIEQAEDELLLDDEIIEAIVRGRAKTISTKAGGFFDVFDHDHDKGGVS